MLVDERAHFGRSASSSVAKNTRGGLRDLVRPAQLGALALEPLDLLPLLNRRQVSSQALVGLGLAHTLAKCLRRRPISRATCAIGGPDSKASRTPRWISSSGYFRGRGIRGGSPLPRTDRPRFGVCAKTRPGSERRADGSVGECLGRGFRRSRDGRATARGDMEPAIPLREKPGGPLRQPSSSQTAAPTCATPIEAQTRHPKAPLRQPCTSLTALLMPSA